MTPTEFEHLIIIAVMSAITLLLRYMPFIVFPRSKKTPEPISHLGSTLPAAVIGLLVIYCLKNVDILNLSASVPEFIALTCVVSLYVWKRNVLLSVGIGTLAYMLMVQFVF